ncbi:uncharacterized protein [Littorina saxatilis]|uniref:uncharacterized protein n=1 Tax=Littorina saxatilis TaxID=31220 RepID=UPI0038B66AE4
MPKLIKPERHTVQGEHGVSLELWLNVEAFEYLRDDPCLPVDTNASGMGELLNSGRDWVDRALGVASVQVQKVISFAWDSDFTCTTKQYKSSLAAQIRATYGKPIVVDCSFHSPANWSIVVKGYNLDQPMSYEINWPAVDGTRQISHLGGYYFELDWGYRNNRVPSIEYTQLYDIPMVLLNMNVTGWIMQCQG